MGISMRTGVFGCLFAALLWTPVTAEESEESELAVRLKAALAGLGSASQTADLKRYLDYLGRHFEEARPLLEQAIRRGPPRVRALVVKLYGDHGTVKDDLGTVSGRLNDHSSTVRMAAVSALRRMGKEGVPALLARIGREPEPGIRKMAVRAVKKWKDPAVVPQLARLLADERHAGVRKHLVQALEWVSGEQYGDDTEAWVALAETYTLKESEKRVLEYSRALTGGQSTSTRQETSRKKEK